jgi:hypothetical protein
MVDLKEIPDNVSAIRSPFFRAEATPHENKNFIFYFNSTVSCSRYSSVKSAA